MQRKTPMSRDVEHGCASLTEPTGTGVRDAVARRVSCRAYHPKPVPEAQLLQILEAARLAPSACNQQPWRFVVVRDLGLRRRIVAEGFLPGIKMTWAVEAPVHVVVGMERSFVTHRLAASVSGVDYPWVDIGIAGEHLVLAATELGLGTCWIGWIKPRVVARIVGWPATVKPVVVITVGWPCDPDAEAPPASRRKPLAELVRWL
jgi:nitroreductase